MNKAYLCSTFFGYRSHANSGSSTTAQASVQTLNPSVVFLETKDVILTNRVWCVVINFGLGSYENVIAIVK